MAASANSAFETDIQAWSSVASQLAANALRQDALDGPCILLRTLHTVLSRSQQASRAQATGR